MGRFQLTKIANTTDKIIYKFTISITRKIQMKLYFNFFSKCLKNLKKKEILRS